MHHFIYIFTYIYGGNLFINFLSNVILQYFIEQVRNTIL